MRIGIITIHNSPNYGACLQSYALWKYLEDQGHDVEIIDLYRPYQKEYIKSNKYKPRQKISYKNRIKQILKSILKRKTSSAFSITAKKKFDDFNSTIKLSVAYKGLDELYKNPPIYDLYISGSDQLWNPTQPYCLEPYFLTFAPYGSRKISYATSIGVTELSEEDKNDFKKWLNSYNSISVREKQAKNLLESFIDKKILQVADPTFLIDVITWKSMSITPNIKTPYLLLFTIGNPSEMVKYCLKLCNEADLKLVVLNQMQPDNKKYIAVRDAGPREFLGYIEKAEMVITDSFHCTVFSLIMGAKNFYTYIRRNNKRGSRIIDLLETYNLVDHLLNTELSTNYEELKANTINRKSVLDTISKEQEKSRKYLDSICS